MTLIELMATISVFGVLISIASPSMTSFIEASRISTVTNEITAALFYSRSESLKRRLNVYLCAKTTDLVEACETTSTASYTNGWLLYADCNNNGTYDTGMLCDFDGDGTNDRSELLKVHDSLVKDIAITTSPSFRQKIGYKISGRSNNAGNFCITVAAKRSKKIIIAATGRVRTEDVADCH